VRVGSRSRSVLWFIQTASKPWQMWARSAPSSSASVASVAIVTKQRLQIESIVPSEFFLCGKAMWNFSDKVTSL
jgi:hypothetical protein